MTSEAFFKSVVMLLVVGWGLSRLLTGAVLLFQHGRVMAIEERLQMPLDETIPTHQPSSRWDAIVFLYGWLWFRRPTFFSKLITNPLVARVIGVLSVLLGVLLVAGGIVGLTEVLGNAG